MKQLCTSLKLIAGAVAAAVIGSSASAQTPTPTTPTTTSTTKKAVPTTATPQMIAEAIQRSKARSTKFNTSGVPEQWGSEEPFTFNPNQQ
jgi:hypothetical protein